MEIIDNMDQDIAMTMMEIEKGADLKKFHSYTLFRCQNKFLHKGQMKYVQAIAEEARARLSVRGLVKCGRWGWFKRTDLGRTGLVYKNKEWIVEDMNKHMAYLSERTRLDREAAATRKAIEQAQMEEVMRMDEHTQKVDTMLDEIAETEPKIDENTAVENLTHEFPKV
jgi:hypothetical protein